MMERWIKTISIADIPLREGKCVRYEDNEIAIFNLGNGDVYAIDNACPHKQGPLAEGIVSGKQVACPLHNLNISLETGCAVSGGEGEAKIYPAKLEGGRIYVQI